jgi:hypothetical protein
VAIEAERLAASSSGSPPATRGSHAASLQRSALVCLAGAALWVVLRASLFGSATASIAGQVALGGAASSTLGLTALAFAPVRPRQHESRAGLAALSLGLGWALVPWALLAHWLRVATHHRPLGAVTFALAASAIALVSVLAARRLVALGHEGQRGRAALRLGRALALVGAAALFALVLRAVAGHEQVRSGLVDVGLALAALSGVAACSAARWPERAPRWAPLVCVGVWATTLLLLAQPDVRATVKSAPIIAGVVGLVLR